MTQRILAATFGALVFAVLCPLLYLLLMGVTGSLMDFVWLAVLGVVAGAILGALLPRVFGFFFEMLLGV
jgi:hypothetical protein